MIATLRGLVALGAIALALLIVVLVAGSPTREASGDRSLVRAVPAELTHLTVWSPAGELKLTKDRDAWRSRSPTFVADPDAIHALVDTVRTARWHRRAAKAAAGSTTRGVMLVAPGVSLTFAVGDELAGAEQTWIVHGEHAYLVDSWVARALAPTELALRQRFPLAAAERDYPITIGTLKVAAGQMIEPHAMRLDAGLYRDLIDALVELEYVSVEGMSPIAAPPNLLVIIGAPQETLAAQRGTCARDLLLVQSPIGDGCVEPAAIQRITDAVTALKQPPAMIADRRPLSSPPTSLVLADGTTLEISGRPHIGDDDVDAERLGELLAALTTPATVRPRRDAEKSTGTLVAKLAGGERTTLELHAPSRSIARAGEPVALTLTTDAWNALTRPAAALRDPVLWREDALSITSIKVGSITYTRGAVLGEWTRDPAGDVDPDLVDALASSLATVRAPSSPPPAPPTHTVSVTFTPPAGKPSTYTLAVGAPAANGCAARYDGASVRIDLASCTAVHALAAAK